MYNLDGKITGVNIKETNMVKMEDFLSQITLEGDLQEHRKVSIMLCMYIDIHFLCINFEGTCHHFLF